MLNSLNLARLFALAACGVSSLSAVTITLSPSSDTSLFSESGSTSNGVGGSLFVGEIQSGNERRALLRFDLSALPAGAVIDSVSLQLRLLQTVSPAVSVSAFRVLADWGEGTSSGSGQGGPASAGDATWTHSVFNTTPWTNPGGDFAPAASASALVGGVAPSSVVWDGAGLAADVAGWLVAPNSNEGWILIASDIGGVSAKRFGSGEATSAGDRPSLTINYTVTAIPEPAAVASWLGGLAIFGAACRRRRAARV